MIVLALATAFTGGSWAMWLATRLWPRPQREHEHEWEVTSAQPAKLMMVAKTLVLWHCRSCTEVQSTELDGAWTTAQVSYQATATVEMPAVKVAS